MPPWAVRLGMLCGMALPVPDPNGAISIFTRAGRRELPGHCHFISSRSALARVAGVYSNLRPPFPSGSDPLAAVESIEKAIDIALAAGKRCQDKAPRRHKVISLHCKACLAACRHQARSRLPGFRQLFAFAWAEPQRQISPPRRDEPAAHCAHPQKRFFTAAATAARSHCLSTAAAPNAISILSNRPECTRPDICTGPGEAAR